MELETASPQSQMELFAEVASLFVKAMSDRGRGVRDLLAEPFASLVDSVEPADSVPFVWSSSFEYRDLKDPELPPTESILTPSGSTTTMAGPWALSSSSSST